MSAPLAIDLFCGLGGWTDGLLAEGYDVIGFDIERHHYGDAKYPAQLVLQDVLTIVGRQFKDAALIVASPPCQAYSYRAMPWSRAKALPPPDNSLFEACFRIQREASEAAGRKIPMVVENVRGAQKWVGRAPWHYGSFYLWGDVPALMPMTNARIMKAGITHRSDGSTNFHGHKNNGGSWFNIGSPGQKETGRNPVHELAAEGNGARSTPHFTNQAEHDGYKQGGISGPRTNGKGDAWFQDGAARHGSKSTARKAASAAIAKIPLPLARHIARVYKPEAVSAAMRGRA